MFQQTSKPAIQQKPKESNTVGASLSQSHLIEFMNDPAILRKIEAIFSGQKSPFSSEFTNTMLSYYQLLTPGGSTKASPDAVRLEMESFGIVGTKAYENFSQTISKIKLAREHSVKILSAKASKSTD